MDTIRTELHERLHRLHRLMRRRHMSRRRGGGPLADTTRGRGRVLAALQMHSPIPTRELAYLLDIRQQSLNELLQKLQADGLVERRNSADTGERRLNPIVPRARFTDAVIGTVLTLATNAASQSACSAEVVSTYLIVPLSTPTFSF